MCTREACMEALLETMAQQHTDPLGQLHMVAAVAVIVDRDIANGNELVREAFRVAREDSRARKEAVAQSGR